MPWFQSVHSCAVRNTDSCFTSLIVRQEPVRYLKPIIWPRTRALKQSTKQIITFTAVSNCLFPFVPSRRHSMLAPCGMCSVLIRPPTPNQCDAAMQGSGSSIPCSWYVILEAFSRCFIALISAPFIHPCFCLFCLPCSHRGMMPLLYLDLTNVCPRRKPRLCAFLMNAQLTYSHVPMRIITKLLYYMPCYTRASLAVLASRHCVCRQILVF